MLSARWCVVCAACMCLVAEARAGAQIGGSQITGSVTDAAGAGVPGATVVAVHVRSGAARQAVSSRSGLYTLAGLAPGEYRVDVELSGFRPVRRQGVRLETGEAVRLDVELVVGAVSELITVTADTPMQRATASLARSSPRRKSRRSPSTGGRSSPWRHSRPAWRCRRRRSCRGSTAAGRAPMSTCSMASRSSNPSRDRLPISRPSTRFRSSSSRPTARQRSSGGSTVASSI
jgi:hypothetical protein